MSFAYAGWSLPRLCPKLWYMSTNPERLASAVKARRLELGLNQMEVWNAGGPSNTTLTTIENGRLDTLTLATAKKLDRGLRWEQGSAMRVWEGGRASPVGPSSQDSGYVAAPGPRVEAGVSDDAVLGAIQQMHDDMRAMEDRLGERIEAGDRALSERLDRLERPDA